ncbi:hypothetical protein CGRA01v4_05714 [Colletotrichum graminicola]|nr:hypothetical protein CGRA01v4_05714 [Colletotrichum graminicola]
MDNDFPGRFPRTGGRCGRESVVASVESFVGNLNCMRKAFGIDGGQQPGHLYNQDILFLLFLFVAPAM